MGGGRDENQVQEQHGSSLSSIKVSVFGKAQGLNEQAKGEVLLSRRDGAAEIFLWATTQGSRNLVVSGCGQDIGDDLGLEPPVVLGIHVSVARF